MLVLPPPPLPLCPASMESTELCTAESALVVAYDASVELREAALSLVVMSVCSCVTALA